MTPFNDFRATADPCGYGSRLKAGTTWKFLTVIASEAKQSIAAPMKEAGLLRSLRSSQ
jgi:hypothetical protein